MSKITALFTELMRKYLPEPFVFTILLTLLTMALAFSVEDHPIDLVVQDRGKGFWSLLACTTSMAVILVMGYVLAAAPVVDRFRNRIAAFVHTPRGAIIMAIKLAMRVKGVHYPLINASMHSKAGEKVTVINTEIANVDAQSRRPKPWAPRRRIPRCR